MENILKIIFLITTISSSISILLGRNWRWVLIFLGIQYFGIFWFVQGTWPLSLAIIKMIAGLIVCIILAFYAEEYDDFALQDRSWPQGVIFRLFAAGLIVISTLAVSVQAAYWMGIPDTMAMWIGLFLIGNGMLQLGITTQTQKVIVALLTLLSGFEIIYAFIETSSLVAALLVLINIGLALIGVYLYLMDQRERSI
ncbi:hypothetical protein ACFLTX_01090 [Chloroflexota bacterium]